MQSGCHAHPETLIAHGFVKPTDSVRAIKKYVSYFNKYTDKHSEYPTATLQEWLAQEEKRQAELESSEQLQLGELVEEESEEAQGEKFQTSGQQAPADEETAPEEIEEIEEETDETENVPRETETQEYDLSTRAKVRDFMADYENWTSRTGLWWLDSRCYSLKNGAIVYAVWSMVLLDIESRKTGRVVHYYLSQNGLPAEITKEQLEKYIAAHLDEL